MITKRGFLTGAASAAALAATAPRGAWSAPAASAEASAVGLPPTSATAAFDAAVFNERYGDAREFAQALERQGVPLLPMAGDAGMLWYGALGKLVAAGGHRLAGLGTSMDLLILESLGREAGLKVRFRARHDCRGSRTLTHSISANHGAHAALVDELGTPDWPARLAAMLPGLAQHASAAQCVSSGAETRVVTDVEPRDDHPGVLFSWILARREQT